MKRTETVDPIEWPRDPVLRSQTLARIRAEVREAMKGTEDACQVAVRLGRGGPIVARITFSGTRRYK